MMHAGKKCTDSFVDATRMRLILRFLLVVWLGAIGGVRGHSDDMCNRHCNTPMIPGQVLMNRAATSSGAYSVSILRNGVALSSGATFVLGDNGKYTVSTTVPINDEWAMEISGGGAYFKVGMCATKNRIYQDMTDLSLVFPSTMTPGTIVKLWAGSANSDKLVHITPAFTVQAVHQPSQSPTLYTSPKPTNRGATNAPTGTPTTSSPTGTPTSPTTVSPTPFSGFVPSASLSALDNSCILSPGLSLSWTVIKNTVLCKLTLTGTVSKWISVGLVQDGMTKMVAPSTSQPNKVWLYAPNTGMAGIFQLLGQSAKAIEKDTTTLLPISGLTALSTDTKAKTVSMSFKLSCDKEPGMVPVNLAGSNNLIYANGGDWPAIHPTGAYGFVAVNWQSGGCSAVAQSKIVSPYCVFILLLLVIIFNSPLVAIRNIPFIAKLHSTRLPFAALGMSDFSISGLIFMFLYALFSLVVLFVGTPGKNLTWADLTVTTGDVAIMNLWMAIIPSSKSNMVSVALFGVPFERAVKYHKIVVSWSLLWAGIHLIANYSACEDVLLSSEPYGPANVVPVMGLIAFVLFCSMSLLALEPIRRAQYEIFWVFHKVYWLAILFVFLHVKSKALGFLPGMLLQAYDLAVKLYRGMNPLTVVHCDVLDGVKGGSETEGQDLLIVHLVVPCASASMGGAVPSKPGQYYFLHVASVSGFEWHPFSVSNCDVEQGLVHFHIKVMPGTSAEAAQVFSHLRRAAASTTSSALATLATSRDLTWTAKLAVQVYLHRGAGDSGLRVACEGPYGDLTAALPRYGSVSLMAGGIGITPMLHTLNCLARESVQRSKSNTTSSQEQLSAAHSSSSTSASISSSSGMISVHLVWSVRDLSIVSLLQNRLLAALDVRNVVESAGSNHSPLHFSTSSDHHHQRPPGSAPSRLSPSSSPGAPHSALRRASGVELSAVYGGSNVEIGDSEYNGRASDAEMAGHKQKVSTRLSESRDKKGSVDGLDIRIDIYVTRGDLHRQEADSRAIALTLNTLVEFNVHFGKRPQIQSVMQRAAKMVGGGADPATEQGKQQNQAAISRCCVLVCGPGPMTEEVVLAASRAGCDVHNEVFSF